MPYTSSFPESFLHKTLVKPDSFELDCYITDTTGAHKWRLRHFQDCCESVNFASANGTWPTGPIVSASFGETDRPDFAAEPKWDSCDSHTWTVLALSDGENKIQLAFLGESNGYYSEDVNLDYWME